MSLITVNPRRDSNKLVGYLAFADNKSGLNRFQSINFLFFKSTIQGWSCCKKRVTDFGEFLAIPGCTAGPHNPNKSEAPVKPDVKNTGAKEKPDFTKGSRSNFISA